MKHLLALAVVIALGAASGQAQAAYCNDPTTHKRISCKATTAPSLAADAKGDKVAIDNKGQRCCRCSCEEVLDVLRDDEAEARDPGRSYAVARAPGYPNRPVNRLNGERRPEDSELHEGQALRQQLHQGDGRLPQAG